MREYMLRSVKGIIFALDETATHDGPGLRMTVFLKGCPLRCIWCHSPESVYPKPEIVWYQNKCDQCGKCLEVCPEKLRSFGPNETIDPKDRRRCRLCQMCIKSCPTGALEVKGEVVCAGEIVDHAKQLIPFFGRSGGGITLTGGEPTLQLDFSYAILALCRHENIHTAVETCGYAPWEKFEKLAPWVNLFLFDFKHPDEKLHRQYTGVSSKLILNNLAKLIALGTDLIVRVPLIPGCNDSPSTIKAIGLKSMELGARKLSLLPFNPASSGKYSWLHRVYPLSNLVGDVKRQSDRYIAELEDMLRNEGMEVISL